MSTVASPPTATAARAVEIAGRFCTPALLNHSLRSYAFAVDLARSEGRGFDGELLFVAAAFHDIGLVPVFDSETQPFEEAGGSIAQVFAAGAGWPVERARRVHEVIVRHMWPSVDPGLDVEGYLLERATSLDVSGAAPDDWSAGFCDEVVEALPRLDFAPTFVACFEQQARRKPQSGAAASVGRGLPARALHNPLDDRVTG